MTGSPDGWGNITTKLVLPDPVDPGEYVCYLVRVPKSKYHITAFLGAIYDLSLWWNWQRDDAHTASLVAQVWRKIWYNLRPQSCLPEPAAAGSCCGDDDMGCCSLRYHNGVLQCFCGGVWQDISGQNNNGGGTQPPAPQPAPGGGQQAYDHCLSAKEQWLLSTTVSSGDTLSLESASGAWNDPTHDVILWRCNDGNQYFAGNCIPGTTELVGTDPLPTAPHMALILLINGVYYDFSSGAFTVPPGITNAPVIIQPNDSTLTDNNGQICFTVNVVNNASVAWTHTLDFVSSPWGFVPDTRSGNQGKWVAGLGWTTDTNTAAFDVKHVSGTAYTITEARASGTDAGPILGFSGVGLYFPVPTALAAVGPVPGNIWTIDSHAISVGPQTQLQFSMDDNSLGAMYWKILHVEGVGFDPWPTAPS